MNFNTAEWIIVCILCATLFVFLICGIILLIKLIGLTKEAKKVAMTAQSIGQKVDSVADNVKNITFASSLTGIANMIKSGYNAKKASKDNQKGNENG